MKCPECKGKGVKPGKFDRRRKHWMCPVCEYQGKISFRRWMKIKIDLFIERLKED